MSILTSFIAGCFRADAVINFYFQINLYFTLEINIFLSFPFLFGYTLAVNGGGPSNIEGALAALDAEDLRELIRDIIPRLDDKTLSRFNNAIIERAAGGKTGWQPSGPTDEAVAEAVTFAKAAKRVGYADPSEVDNYLRQGSNAFLRRIYPAASQIFHAVLLPISEGEIDLGQDEMFEEMLGMNASDCAAQYVVAVYMTSALEQRADAVLRAIEDMSNAGSFWEPLREMERVSVEPLPDFNAFLRQWRALVQEACKGEGSHQWDIDVDRWLREAVRRTDGTEGLAGIARSTRRSDDLQAWLPGINRVRRLEIRPGCL